MDPFESKENPFQDMATNPYANLEDDSPEPDIGEMSAAAARAHQLGIPTEQAAEHKEFLDDKLSALDAENAIVERHVEGMQPYKGFLDAVFHSPERGIENVAMMSARSARMIAGKTEENTKEINDMRAKFAIEREYLQDLSPGQQQIASALESSTSSLLTMTPGIVLAPVSGLASLVAAGATTYALYGLSTADEFLERVEELGLSRSENLGKAMMAGLAEGGFETLSNIVGAKVFKLLGGNTLMRTEKRALFAAFQDFTKKLGITTGVEVTSEMANAGVQAGLGNEAGMPEQDPLEAAGDAFVPAVLQSLIMGGGMHTASAAQQKIARELSPTVEMLSDGGADNIEANSRPVVELMLRNTNYRMRKAETETRNFRDSLRAAIGMPKKGATKRMLGLDQYPEEAKMMERAIMLNIDLRNMPGDIQRYYNDLPEQWMKDAVDLSIEVDNNQELAALRDEVIIAYKREGAGGQKDGVLGGLLSGDGYVARAWRSINAEKSEPAAGPETRHDFSRKYTTILQGWARGDELLTSSVFEGLEMYKKDLARAAGHKQLIDTLENSYFDSPRYAPLMSVQEMAGLMSGDRPVAAQTDYAGQKIKIDPEMIQKTFDEKAWTDPKVEGVKALPEDSFKTVEEWRDFVLAHEDEHFIQNEIGATMILEKAELENKANDRALEMLENHRTSGLPFLATEKRPGYKRITNKTFKKKVIDENGKVKMLDLYAPKPLANDLNKLLTASMLDQVPNWAGGKLINPTVRKITKYNSVIKAMRLQSTFFHHQAFLRSYYLAIGADPSGKKTPYLAIEAGQENIRKMTPMWKLGVEESLTLGINQDWSEASVLEGTIFGKALSATPLVGPLKDKVMLARNAQQEYLFGEMGAGLKMQAFVIKMGMELQARYGKGATAQTVTEKELRKTARSVAGLINDDFGGINRGYTRRGATKQHLLDLMLLGSDWTESNINSFTKVFKGGDVASKKMYARMWTGIMVKGAIWTTVLNFVSAGGDLEEMYERYEKAEKEGSYNWAKVDITPLYKTFGGTSERSKYWNFSGHFLDIPKMLTRSPVKTLRYKGSAFEQFTHEAFTGQDWRGQTFTNMDELWEFGKRKEWKPGNDWIEPIGPMQWPSFLFSQIIEAQPVQLQNYWDWRAGTMEGFDATLNSLGVGIDTSYEPLQKEDN